MSGYEVDSSTVVYEGYLGRVRIDDVRMPGGGTAVREVAEHLDAVAIVPVHDDGTVVLVRQYRHAVGEHLLEIPAGLLDVDGEAPVDAARRELAEEVGLAAGRLERLVRFHNSAGWSNESTIVYLAADLREDGPPEGFEAEHEEVEIEVVRLPLADAVAMARGGAITDAKTVVGLLLAGTAERPPGH